MTARADATWREPYLGDADGGEWHVYDVARIDGRIRRRDLGDPFATRRVFVAREGRQVSHTFAAGERRGCTAEVLERQLKLALSGAAWADTHHPVRRARR